MHQKNKVGTLTFHGVINHGAVLQAYALQKFILNLGYETELVNYKPFYFIKQVYRPAKGFRKTLTKYRKFQKFNKFCAENLRVNSNRISTLKSFSNLDGFDTLVVGSDQVWNKTITNFKLDPVFFLKGAKANNKISYAASSGSFLLSKEPAINEYLSGLDHIGVREGFLAENINTVVENNCATMVLDPTLLLDDYSSVIKSEINLPYKYIVSYEVSTDETRLKFEEALNIIKKNLGYKVIHIGDKAIESADRNITEIGPNDWLYLVKNSEFVVTNSFHGTAFSVNFKKPFVMISHVDEGRNTRPFNFLSSIGFENNYIEDLKELNKDFLSSLKTTQNYDKLVELQDISKNFLINALKNETST